jgi:hypothetical protein
MTIKVYNDDNEVFHGPVSQFLADNDNDEWLTKECKKLETVNQIEFTEISGDWRIEKQ